MISLEVISPKSACCHHGQLDLSEHNLIYWPFLFSMFWVHPLPPFTVDKQSIQFMKWPIPTFTNSTGIQGGGVYPKYVVCGSWEFSTPESRHAVCLTSNFAFRNTPWKINMEPKNHLFEKENHLPNLHYYVPCESSGVYINMSIVKFQDAKDGFCGMKRLDWSGQRHTKTQFFIIYLIDLKRKLRTTRTTNYFKIKAPPPPRKKTA